MADGVRDALARAYHDGSWGCGGELARILEREWARRVPRERGVVTVGRVNATLDQVDRHHEQVRARVREERVTMHDVNADAIAGARRALLRLARPELADGLVEASAVDAAMDSLKRLTRTSLRPDVSSPRFNSSVRRSTTFILAGSILLSGRRAHRPAAADSLSRSATAGSTEVARGGSLTPLARTKLLQLTTGEFTPQRSYLLGSPQPTNSNYHAKKKTNNP